MSEIIDRLTKAMEGMTAEKAESDSRFNCIRYQQTVGPMSMNMITKICIDKVPLVRVLNDNEYNDYDVMLGIYNQTLHVWAESELDRLTTEVTRVTRYREALREAYEVWAGSEALMQPATAPEAYVIGLVDQMINIIAPALTTDSGKQ